MAEKLKAVLSDRPLWVGAIVLVLFVAWALKSDPAQLQSSNVQMESVLSIISKRESVRRFFDRYNAIQADPILDDNGNPIDAQGILAELSDAVPRMLAETEQKYGENDPRTIPSRTAMVAVLLKKKQALSALLAIALADENYAIATGDGLATAEQVFSALKSVLLTTPRTELVDDQAKRLNELAGIVDDRADEAPGKAADLYTDIAARQTRLGRHDDAARSFRSVVALDQGADTNYVALAAAHIGLSGQAWKAGDCETALSHAIQSMVALENTDLGDQLRAVVARKTAPIVTQCGP